MEACTLHSNPSSSVAAASHWEGLKVALLASFGMRNQRLSRRLLFPILERDFTYRSYERLLQRLADTDRFRVVPLHEFAATVADARPVIALRHDVDRWLDSAVTLARLERAAGLQATYFVLHTAAYWQQDSLVPTLRTLQDDLGHEVGWHNDLVTLNCVLGVDARGYLRRELARLRTAGVRVSGVSAHGSPHCYRLGYHNNYFFSDFPERMPEFPNDTVVHTENGDCPIPKARLADFDFEYEAYHLDNNLYFSDSSFDERERRWHPKHLDLDELSPGDKVIILIHPCHWDDSVAAKFSRLGVLSAERLLKRGSSLIPSRSAA